MADNLKLKIKTTTATTLVLFALVLGVISALTDFGVINIALTFGAIIGLLLSILIMMEVGIVAAFTGKLKAASWVAIIPAALIFLISILQVFSLEIPSGLAAFSGVLKLLVLGAAFWVAFTD